MESTNKKKRRNRKNKKGTGASKALPGTPSLPGQTASENGKTDKDGLIHVETEQARYYDPYEPPRASHLLLLRDTKDHGGRCDW